MGGFIGAVLGAVLFYKVIRKRPFWTFADLLAFAFPFAWFFGRLGCFSAHDHIGRPSHFFLAMDFPRIGPRHELGLYEAMWTAVIAGVFWVRRNKPFRPGEHVAWLAILYAPVRFMLDFLRNSDLPGADVRYGGLTFAQYGTIGLGIAGVALLGWLRRADAPTRGPS
jgi:phosphatidylglycerol:prolipoprotein diacylglycerol transferase